MQQFNAGNRVVARRLGSPGEDPQPGPDSDSPKSTCTQKWDSGKGATLSTKFRGPQVPDPAAPPRLQSQSGGRDRGNLQPRGRRAPRSPSPRRALTRRSLRAPRAVARPVQPRGGVPRPAACRAATGAAPPTRHVTRLRPPTSRLATATGSAGSHWFGGGARTGAPGLHNRRRVGGGEGS